MSEADYTIDLPASARWAYQAFAEPGLLVRWLAPEGMNARLRDFEFRIGAGFGMELRYPEGTGAGKSGDGSDRYRAIITDLVPDRLVRLEIIFDTTDPGFERPMIMEYAITDHGESSSVRIGYTDLPAPIRQSDNAAGTRSSLERLRRLALEANA